MNIARLPMTVKQVSKEIRGGCNSGRERETTLFKDTCPPAERKAAR